MSNPSHRGPVTRVLLDVNTQCDFLLPRGAVPVANRGEVLPNIHRIMRWGRNNGIPIISSLEAHRPSETTNGLPPHCVDHSPGQRKLPFTLMASRMLICGDNTSDLPLELFRKYQQLVFTKRDRDLFSNPKADRLVNIIRPTYFAVCGVLTERCIKIATLGLISRRHRVVVIRDACGHWSPADGELALRQMSAKGAFLATTEELISGQVDATVAEAIRVPPVKENVEAADSREVKAAGNGNGNGQSSDRRRVVAVVKVTLPLPAAPCGPAAGNGKGRRRAAPPAPPSITVAAARPKASRPAMRRGSTPAPS